MKNTVAVGKMLEIPLLVYVSAVNNLPDSGYYEQLVVVSFSQYSEAFNTRNRFILIVSLI